MIILTDPSQAANDPMMIGLSLSDDLTNLVFQFDKTIGDEISAINNSLRENKLCFIDEGSYKYDIIIDAENIRKIKADTHAVRNFRIMLEPISGSHEFSQIKCSDKLSGIHTIKFRDNTLLKYYRTLYDRLYAEDINGGCHTVKLDIELVEGKLHISVGVCLSKLQLQGNCTHKMKMMTDDKYRGQDLLYCTECGTLCSPYSLDPDDINNAITTLTTMIHQIKLNVENNFIHFTLEDNNSSLQRLLRHLSEAKQWARFYNGLTNKMRKARKAENPSSYDRIGGGYHMGMGRHNF